MRISCRRRGVDTNGMSQSPELNIMDTPLGEIQQVALLAEPRMYMPVFLTALRLRPRHS